MYIVQEEGILVLDKEDVRMVMKVHNQNSFNSLSHSINCKRLLQIL